MFAHVEFKESGPQATHLAEAPEGAVLQDSDVVLVEVDVVELAELPQGACRHLGGRGVRR